MTNINICDKCKTKEDSLSLIWIDTEDFKPLKKDKFNFMKHQTAIEIFGFSALCYDCYKMECCN